MIRSGPTGAVARSEQRSSGQALVEFSFAIILFLVILMAVLDFGRAIYMFNGVSQAAREIARTTSVHPVPPGGGSLGASPETASVIATQRGLIPGLEDPTFACVDISGAAVSGACLSGSSVKVTIHAPYQAVTPLLSFLGSFDLASSTSIKIQ